MSAAPLPEIEFTAYQADGFTTIQNDSTTAVTCVSLDKKGARYVAVIPPRQWMSLYASPKTFAVKSGRILATAPVYSQEQQAHTISLYDRGAAPPLPAYLRDFKAADLCGFFATKLKGEMDEKVVAALCATILEHRLTGRHIVHLARTELDQLGVLKPLDQVKVFALIVGHPYCEKPKGVGAGVTCHRHSSGNATAMETILGMLL